ncbi:MAG: adenylate kinase [Atribacterota bacterium]|nr:adenylate kinase [Atribacterota bacterium]
MKLILLGPPGAGKGTIANEINKKINIPVISTGDILRNSIKNNTKLGKEAQEYVTSGKLVPDDLIMSIVEERIKDNDCQNGFMFDGFPRTIQQAIELDSLMRRLNTKIDQVFYFEASDSVIVERLSDRRVCAKCGAIYNLNYNSPKIENVCDKCGGQLFQRDDDKQETILNRIKVFNKETLPLVEYYEEKNNLTKINADLDLKIRFEDVWNRLIKLGLVGK